MKKILKIIVIIFGIISILTGTFIAILTTEKEYFAKEYNYTMEVENWLRIY